MAATVANLTLVAGSLRRKGPDPAPQDPDGGGNGAESTLGGSVVALSAAIIGKWAPNRPFWPRIAVAAQ
jgi:hypothetical protein